MDELSKQEEPNKIKKYFLGFFVMLAMTGSFYLGFNYLGDPTWELDDKGSESVQQIDAPILSDEGNVIKLPDVNNVNYSYEVSPIDSSAHLGEVIERKDEIVIPANGIVEITAIPVSGSEVDNQESHTWEYEYDSSAVASDSKEYLVPTWFLMLGGAVLIVLLVGYSKLGIRLKGDKLPKKEDTIDALNGKEGFSFIEERDNRVRQWDDLRARYDTVVSSITDYEMDLNLALSYPVMNDLSDKKTQRMVKALKYAKSCHLAVNEDGIGGSGELLHEYSKAIVSLETSFELAKRNAEKIALKGISEMDRKDFELARNLLNHVEDLGNNANIRASYMGKLKEVIERIDNRKNVVIPKRIITALEDATRKEIDITSGR